MLLNHRRRLIKYRSLTLQPNSEQCLICTEPLTPKFQAELPCQHKSFCLKCILDWASITNRCPLCKLRFSQIKSLSSTEIFRVIDKDQNRIDESWFIETRCDVCGSDLDDDIMLLCDRCDKGFHTICLKMIGIPDIDRWYCDECIGFLNWSQRKKVIKSMMNAGRVWGSPMKFQPWKRLKKHRVPTNVD